MIKRTINSVRSIRPKLLHGQLIAFLRGQLAQDVIWLYSIHLLNYVLPLLLIPYLSRVMGASGWGVVAFTNAFASFIALAIEYGFYVSAQREAARHYQDAEKLSQLFNGVLSAKLLIGCCVAVGAFFASKWLPILSEDRRLFPGALFFGTTQALSFGWYFRGIQRIRLAASMEALAKGLSVLLAILVISRPQDAWKYFVAFGSAQLLVLIVSYAIASKNLRLRLPSFSAGVRALRDGWPVFLLHISGSTFTTSSVFMVGLLSTPQIVGYFAGAEKIARAVASLMEPIRNAMFPRMSLLFQVNEENAKVFFKRVLLFSTVAGASLGCAVFVMAPILVSSLLGREFYSAKDSLRILALLPLLSAINAAFGFLWMLPRGHELKGLRVLAIALVANVVLALALVPSFQNVGMAIGVVITETLIVLGYYVLYLADKNETNAEYTDDR